MGILRCRPKRNPNGMDMMQSIQDRNIAAHLVKHGPSDAAKDWLFVDIPEPMDQKLFEKNKHNWQHKCTDPDAWLGTIYNGWNISHEYEDIFDVPRELISDTWYPRFIDNDYAAGAGEVNDYYSNQRSNAAYRYGRVKVNGRWVWSYWQKIQDGCYKYFYHHMYKGPKKPRPQNLWPHNIK